MNMPNLQKQRIIEYIKQGKRFDGRKFDEYRDINVEMGISKNAESSCSVKIGNTEVYAGIKMGLAEPYPDSPDQGTLMVSAELSPFASDEYELGPPKIGAIELARVVDRGLRESGVIDFKKLCIKEGEKVWQVFVDIQAINEDGNLMDVASLAALIALCNAKLPVYDEKEGKIEHKLSKESLPINKDAIAFNMTLHKIGGEIVVDPSREEEEVSDYRISIAISENKGKPLITAMQKGKESAVSLEEIEKVLKIVEDKWKEIFPKIKEYAIGK